MPDKPAVVVGFCRFILQSRSQYFKQLFRDVPLEDSLVPNRRVSIVVPDSRDALLQLLAFIYTGQLVDTSTASLLDGISTADRYKVDDMKCKLLHLSCKYCELDPRGSTCFRIQSHARAR